MFQLVLLFPKLMAQVEPVLEEVKAGLSDGSLSEDEAAQIGRDVLADAPDIRIRIKGRDIVSAEAQRDLGAALGRIAWRLLRVPAGESEIGDGEGLGATV